MTCAEFANRLSKDGQRVAPFICKDGVGRHRAILCDLHMKDPELFVISGFNDCKVLINRSSNRVVLPDNFLFNFTKVASGWSLVTFLHIDTETNPIVSYYDVDDEYVSKFGFCPKVCSTSSGKFPAFIISIKLRKKQNLWEIL